MLDLRETTEAGDGERVTLRLDVRGEMMSEARVRLADGTTLPMRKNEDGSFELTLHRVSQKLRLRAETANTRTKWMTVLPAKLEGGETAEATTRGNQKGVQASTNNAQGGEGQGTGAPPSRTPIEMTSAVGVLLEQAGSVEEKNRLMRLVEQAPVEYREQVARYLMNIREGTR